MGRAAIYKGNSFSDGKAISQLKVEKIVYTPKSKTATIPLENGQAVFDSRIIDPAEVSVTVKCLRPKDGEKSGADIVGDIFANKDQSFYSVTDGMGLAIDGLIPRNLPYTRTPDQFDIAIVELLFDRPIIVGDGSKPYNSDNSDSVGLGYAHGVKK